MLNILREGGSGEDEDGFSSDTLWKQKLDRKSIDAFGHWYWKRFLKISWIPKKTHKRILE